VTRRRSYLQYYYYYYCTAIARFGFSILFRRVAYNAPLHRGGGFRYFTRLIFIQILSDLGRVQRRSYFLYYYYNSRNCQRVSFAKNPLFDIFPVHLIMDTFLDCVTQTSTDRFGTFGHRVPTKVILYNKTL